MTWLWTQNLIVTLAYSTFFFKHVHLSSVSLEEFAAQNPTICKQTNLCRKYEFEYVVRNKTVFTKPTPDLDKIRFQFYLMPWFNWNYTDHGQFMPLLLINVMLELIPPFSKEKLYSTSFDFGFLLKNRRIPDGLEQYMYSYEHQTPYTLFECYSEINNLKGVHIWTGNFSAYNVPQAAPFIPMGTNYCSYNKAKQRMEALFMMSTEWPADFSNKDALYSYRFFNYGLVYPDPHGIDYFELIEVVANVSQFGLPEEKMEEDKERDERDVNQSLFISNKFNQTKDAEILHTYNVRKLPAPKSDDRFDVEWNYYSYSNRLLMLECIRSNETCMVATKTGLRTPNTSLCHDSDQHQCPFLMIVRRTKNERLLFAMYLESEYITDSFSVKLTFKSTKSFSELLDDELIFFCGRRDNTVYVNLMSHNGTKSLIIRNGSSTPEDTGSTIYYSAKVLHCHWFMPTVLKIEKEENKKEPTMIDLQNHPLELHLTTFTSLKEDTYKALFPDGLNDMRLPEPQLLQLEKSDGRLRSDTLWILSVILILVATLVFFLLLIKRARAKESIPSSINVSLEKKGKMATSSSPQVLQQAHQNS